MIHRFGVFEFDDATGELRKSGRVISLEPQPAKALARLLSRAGDVVTRDEMRDAVWGRETHVDFDRGLAYCVSQIRTALGDSGENPRFVQTIPRKGFKFVAPVIGATVPAGSNGSNGSNGSKRSISSKGIVLAASLILVVGAATWLLASRSSKHLLIAVSIFDNETGDPQFDRPVAGLSDLVVEHLTRIDPRIAVIGNAEVLRRPRNIRNLHLVAESVKADYVLLGQLQKGEAGLRFITHFIRLNDESHLKANRLRVAPDLGGLEAAVVGEFDRAVREHVLHNGAN